MLEAIVLTDGRWEDVSDLAQMSELIGTPGNILWASADVGHLTPEDVQVIAEEFGLDDLAVEDAMNLRQRPKLEAYESHLFAVMHQLDTIDEQLEASQIACFIGQRWVLTLHGNAQRTLDEVRQRCSKLQKEPDQGPSFLMHTLLDAIVDDYQLIADVLEESIEQLEERALREPSSPFQGELYSMKQKLARLRRYVTPGERVLAVAIEPSRFNLINERTAGAFRDVHDHLQRIIDQIRNVDDLVEAVIDLQRAEQAHQQNQATKLLSAWAAIVAVPTFIASVYGMNFKLIPADGELLGFIFALGMMTVTGVTLFIGFRKRGWI